MPIGLQKWLPAARRADLTSPALKDGAIGDYSQPIRLNTGAPPFPLPLKVKATVEASVAATSDLSYPPNAGTASMRAAVAETLVARGLPLGADDVRITYGALGALNGTLGIITGPGQEVLIPAPFWFAFPEIILLTGAALRVIPTSPEDDFRLTPERLERAITPKTGLLLLTNPNNPNGYIYTQEELAGLVEVLERYPYLLVVSDELYDLLVYVPKKPGSIGAFSSMRDRVFTISSMSKNFAMSGLRVGWVAATRALRARFPTFEAQVEASAGVNVWLQAGALSALNDTQGVVGPILAQLTERKARAAELLSTIPGLRFQDAEAAYFFFVDVQHYIGMEAPPRIRNGNWTPITDDVALAEYLSQEVNVDVVPGTRCGYPGYFRMTFGVETRIWTEGVARMQIALRALRLKRGATSGSAIS